MRTSSFNLGAACLLLAAASAQAQQAGAIYAHGAYSPLTSGQRAAQVGDILSVVLVERTSASKSNSAGLDRGGSVGLTPPVTGPFNFINPTDLNASGAQSFTGKGDAAQSNALTGEIAVVVVGVRPNGVLEVKGDKLFRLNRGDERIELTGLVRPSDIGADNRVFSPRLADARISYVGKGEIARASRQGWLQRFFARISPF